MVWQVSITHKLSRRICLNKVVIEDLMLILMAPRWTNQECLQAFWTCPYLSITTTSNFASVLADILQVSPSDSDSPVFSRMAALYDNPKEICFWKMCPQGELNHIGTPHHQFMIQVINHRRLVQYTRELIQSVPLLEKLQNVFYLLLAYQVAIGHIPASYGRSISSDPDLSRLCESLIDLSWPVFSSLAYTICSPK